MLHQKLFLKNKPDEVQSFGIFHGFNLLMVNRAIKHEGFTFRLGAGVVVAHPEVTVRGRKLPEDEGHFNDGYYLAGPVVQVAAGRRFYLGKKFFIALEGKATAAYARVPIKDGRANFSNVALHGLLGAGLDF